MNVSILFHYDLHMLVHESVYIANMVTLGPHVVRMYTRTRECRRARQWSELVNESIADVLVVFRTKLQTFTESVMQ